MAQPIDRIEFKDYCLRKLGSPVIQINVSDDQIEDRIDEAINFYRDYHYDGSVLVYLRHELTQADLDNGYITIPSRMLGVTRIFDLQSDISSSSLFSAKYHFVANSTFNSSSYKLSDYYIAMQNIQMMQEWLVGKPMIRYNRRDDKLYIDVSKEKLIEGAFVIIEGYDIIDENENQDFWKDRWLQNYATVLIKEQWGSNLTKFNNMQLIGGTSFNGEQIYNDAKEERKTMEEQAINTLQPLIYHFMG